MDGDDTLWFVEPLYDAARDAARRLVSAAGLDGDRWEVLEREIDVRNVDRLGVDPARFPASCVEAYAAVAAESGRKADERVSDAVRDAAATVFFSPAPVHHLAGKLLDLLRQHGTVVLLTKGDLSVQHRRIEQAELSEAFDEIKVVTVKDESAFGELLSAYRIEPGRGVSIGNSLPSDINPALRVGMKAIWVDSHVREYERRETVPATPEGPDGPLWLAPSLDAVPDLVATIVATQS